MNGYVSGRIHEVKDNYYVIEHLKDVKTNAMKMKLVQKFKRKELVVVYSAWCSKCWIAV